MRPVFVCVGCGCVYLPPKAMRYPETGVEASPLHCGESVCRRQAEGIPGPLQALMVKQAWARAERWMERELSALPERARRRARSHRPGGARSKLR